MDVNDQSKLDAPAIFQDSKRHYLARVDHTTLKIDDGKNGRHWVVSMSAPRVTPNSSKQDYRIKSANRPYGPIAKRIQALLGSCFHFHA